MEDKVFGGFKALRLKGLTKKEYGFTESDGLYYIKL